MTTKFFNFLFTAMLFTTILYAQRKPTPQEEKVITLAVNAINNVVKRFENNNWQLSSGGITAPEYYSVKIHPGRPMDVAPFQGDWNFTIRLNSPLYNEKIQPYIAKISSPPTDPNDKQAWDEYMHSTDKIRNLQHIYVEPMLNCASIFTNPAKGNSRDLKIPGCYYAYKQVRTETIPGTDYQMPGYVLLFGDWSKTKNDNGEYLFHFKHTHSTPYIENIVLILSGNEEQIKEWLKKADWTKINEGLTL